MWYVQIIILFHICILPVFSQTNDIFIQNLNISINNSIIYADSSFTQKIIKKAEMQKFNYTISSMAYADDFAYTKVRIPQTFNRNEVVEQCALYYYLLQNEHDRKREHIEVYPFFEPLNNKPSVIVQYYGNGILKIRFRKWKNIPALEKPTTVEAEIYNQVIDLSFNQAEIFGTIDSNIFKKVAEKNDLDVIIVNDIYKKVLLWQKSQ